MLSNTEAVQIFFLVFAALLMLILFLSKFLNDRPKVRKMLSEPAMTLLVGMLFSFLISVFFVEEEDFEETENNDGEQNINLKKSILSFPSRVFFMALLPPILFNSGYELQRELFYRHFGPIALFSCLGTCISGFATGFVLYLVRQAGWLGDFNPTLMELLTFGALIAATDTVSVVGILQAKKVDPHLFSLVFGESALNDAVAIVLFKTLGDFLVQDEFGDTGSMIRSIAKYILSLLIQAVGSPILGVAFSFLMGIAFKHGDFREHKMLELSLYILPMYVPFILSEVCSLSGMITIFFAGISAKRYMEPNVSDATKEHSKVIFRLFAFLAETCIFLELGLSVFGLSGSFQWQFIGFAFCAALLGRALSIYPLSLVYNLSLTKPVCNGLLCDDTSIETLESIQDSIQENIQKYASSTAGSSWTSRRETPERKRDKTIPVNFMHMLWFVGLRGAVAYACACHFPDIYGHNDEFVAATMVIVLVTIIIMGGGTEPLMDHLKIRTGVDEKEYMRHWHAQRRLKGRFHRFEYNYIYLCVVRQESTDDRTTKHTFTPVIDATQSRESDVASDTTTEWNRFDIFNEPTTKWKNGSTIGLDNVNERPERWNKSTSVDDVSIEALNHGNTAIDYANVGGPYNVSGSSSVADSGADDASFDYTCAARYDEKTCV